MSQSYCHFVSTESGAAQFANTQTALDKYKSEIDDDFYILDNVPELLSKGSIGKEITLPSGKKVEINFSLIFKVFQDFDSIEKQFSALRGQKLDQDIQNLNVALKKTLTGYNDLEVPYDGGKTTRLTYTDKDGNIRNANAWDLLQEWRGRGDEGLKFHFHIEGEDLGDAAWAQGKHFGSQDSCHSGTHHTELNTNDYSQIHCTKHENNCGRVQSMDFDASAQAIAPYLHYDHVNAKGEQEPFSGKEYFDKFLADHGWS